MAGPIAADQDRRGAAEVRCMACHGCFGTAPAPCPASRRGRCRKRVAPDRRGKMGVQSAKRCTRGMPSVSVIRPSALPRLPRAIVGVGQEDVGGCEPARWSSASARSRPKALRPALVVGFDIGVMRSPTVQPRLSESQGAGLTPPSRVSTACSRPGMASNAGEGVIGNGAVVVIAHESSGRDLLAPYQKCSGMAKQEDSGVIEGEIDE